MSREAERIVFERLAMNKEKRLGEYAAQVTELDQEIHAAIPAAVEALERYNYPNGGYILEYEGEKRVYWDVYGKKQDDPLTACMLSDGTLLFSDTTRRISNVLMTIENVIGDNKPSYTLPSFYTGVLQGVQALSSDEYLEWMTKNFKNS